MTTDSFFPALGTAAVPALHHVFVRTNEDGTISFVVREQPHVAACTLTREHAMALACKLMELTS